MADYWKGKSGEYAGYSEGDDFFNSKGKHVGIFKGNSLHSNRSGRCIAKVINQKYLCKSSGGAVIGVYDKGMRGAKNKGNIGASGSCQEDPDLD